MMSKTSIPVISISEYRRDKGKVKEIASKWDEAMKEYGFCVITFDNIENKSTSSSNNDNSKKSIEPSPLARVSHRAELEEDDFLMRVKKLMDAMKKFFLNESDLPQSSSSASTATSKQGEDKAKFMSQFYGDPNGGYNSFGFEKVGKSYDMDILKNKNLSSSVGNGNSNSYAGVDPIESFSFIRRPESWDLNRIPPVLVDPAKEYYEMVEKLMIDLHELSAISLGLDPTYFHQFFSPLSNAECFLKLSCYHPQIEQNSSHIYLYSPHTDYQGFTILYQDPNDNKDSKGGLHFLGKDGVWIKVPAMKNAVIVNAGDFWPIWTNGRWKSCIHCVLKGQSKNPRLSIPFFTGPRSDATVEPVIGDPKERIFEAVKAGEHLQQKLKKSSL